MGVCGVHAIRHLDVPCGAGNYRMDVSVKHYPMPPSVNELYLNLRKSRFGKGSGMARTKSPEYRKYELQVLQWRTKHAWVVETLRSLATRCGPGRVIRIDHVFHAPRNRVITLDKRPKPNDATNYFKALHDTLAKVMETDDKWFWCGSYDREPYTSGDPSLPNGWVNMQISLVERPW